MKKYLLIIFFIFTFFLQLPFLGKISIAHAQNPPAAVAPAGNAPAAPGTAVAPGAGPAAVAPAAAGAPLTVGTAPAPPDGSWLSDSDVTFAGKNAARSRDLFNWVLTNYQWSTDDNTLIAFWAKIRNVVYIFLILLVMVTAFLMIITGGQSFTAIQFIRKFLLVIILITFSFAIIRILYQIVDVIQLFFIKNPDGKIISSVDLLNISFKYEDFVGYRKYGPSYDESAFMSLLLTKLTAATYFVMAGVLIVRKVILWFFITVSPIYPILLLYFPVRNTAKIWIGEFFRWLLYAPLFAIFLSGLVVLWRQNINVLPFNFDAAGAQPTIVYPTAINILLGGPGQKLGIANSINYKDTFAEYIVALIMLWVVIFLPFLLLRIFLDYFSSMSVNNNSAWKYITSNANKILPSNDFFPNKNQPTPPSTPPPPPTFYPTGAARELPMPTGVARNIPVSRPAATTYQSSVRQQSNVRQQTVQTSVSQSTATPVYKSQNTSVATSQLVNFPIPTMRDVAKYETSRISSQTSTRQETAKVNETLQKIANPQSITNPVERKQFSEIKEKLVQAQSKGEPLATSILNAANNVTNKTTVSNKSNVSNISTTNASTSNVSNVTKQATTQVQQSLQKIANTQSITNVTEKQQATALTENLTQQSKQGNAYATTILSTVNHMSSQSSQQTSSQVQQIVQKLANPESVKNVTERQQITQLKQSLKQEKEKGNPIAGSILAAAENVQKAQTTEQGILPAINQVQTVNLEDYEEVKKTWTENYQKLDVPKSLDNPDMTRAQWINKDLANTTHTIDLLSSQDTQKVKEGMSEVSSLLPFLLVGGFSQAEIVAYLQAKKHAAEKVLAETQQSKQEEETLLETTKRHTETSRHMEESLPDNDNSARNTGSIDNDPDIDEDNPLYKATHQVDVPSQNSPTKDTNSTQQMQLANFSIPTMRNVAEFEAANLNPQNPVHSRVEQMNDMLQKLANPEKISDEHEKQTYLEMKKQLEQSKAQGDPLAKSILATVEHFTKPEEAASVPLPKENQVQKVNVEDYEEVRKTWKENYQKLPVPKNSDNPEQTREEWIQEDVTKTTNAINLLTSADMQQKKEGMLLVASLLPFLLLGGFSEEEVISYLQAKKYAGEDVLKDQKEKQSDTDTLLEVSKKENTENIAAAIEEKPEIKEETEK